MVERRVCYDCDELFTERDPDGPGRCPFCGSVNTVFHGLVEDETGA